MRGVLASSLAAALFVTIVPGAVAQDERGVSPASPNPLLGESFFVDHEQPSWRQWRAYRARGQVGRAALVWRIAREPKFRWFGRFSRPARREVQEYIRRAQRVGQVPLIAPFATRGEPATAATPRAAPGRMRRRGRGSARSPTR